MSIYIPYITVRSTYNPKATKDIAKNIYNFTSCTVKQNKNNREKKIQVRIQITTLR